MATSRSNLEMVMYNDLHGKDNTKAAFRAVKDAIHHSSLHFLKSFDLDRKSIIIHVKIGVQDPKSVNIGEIEKIIPFENAQIHVEEGGLDVVDEEMDDTIVIASAAVEVMLPILNA